MNTKRVIFLACCALIGAIAFGTLNIHMTHAFGTRIATNTAYYENNEKRSVDASDKTIIILILRLNQHLSYYHEHSSFRLNHLSGVSFHAQWNPSSSAHAYLFW